MPRRALDLGRQSAKVRASQNVSRHGQLSIRLLLDDECSIEVDNVLTDLQAVLLPVGFLELALVERIAMILWRQRRLVTAETSGTILSRMTRMIAGAVTSELGLGYGSELKEEDLNAFDQSKPWSYATGPSLGLMPEKQHTASAISSVQLRRSRAGIDLRRRAAEA